MGTPPFDAFDAHDAARVRRDPGADGGQPPPDVHLVMRRVVCRVHEQRFGTAWVPVDMADAVPGVGSRLVDDPHQRRALTFDVGENLIGVQGEGFPATRRVWGRGQLHAVRGQDELDPAADEAGDQRGVQAVLER